MTKYDQHLIYGYAVAALGGAAFGIYSLVRFLIRSLP
jgi:hypothetical protein